MTKLYLSNGADASSPFIGGGAASGVLEALRRLGASPHPVKLGSYLRNPARFLAVVATTGLLPSQRRSLYFLPRGQELKWSEPLAPGSVLIDFFQVSPQSHLADDRFHIFKYIDMTLRQLFEYKEYNDLAKKNEIFEYERLSYKRAERIFCFTDWARKSVIEDYGIAPAKVEALRSGANLSLDLLGREATGDAGERPGETLRMVFAGRDWRRKGLPTLSAAAERLNARGIAAEIIAMGPDPAEVAHLPFVQPTGFIDKTREMTRIVQLVRSSDLGVLWSSAEGLPNSLMESLALGVPILTSGIPPIKAGLAGAAALILEPGAGPDAIADAIFDLWSTPGAYERLKAQAVREAASFTWLPAAQHLKQMADDYEPALTVAAKTVTSL